LSERIYSPGRTLWARKVLQKEDMSFFVEFCAKSGPCQRQARKLPGRGKPPIVVLASGKSDWLSSQKKSQ